MKLFGIIQNRFTRIKKGTCSFTSFSGQCNDSPLCISIELHKRAPWIVQNWIVSKNHITDVPAFANAYIINSRRANKAINSSEIIIDNVYGPYSVQVFKKNKSRIIGVICKLFGKKEGQKVYSTWHGNPIKKIGRDQINNEVVDFVCSNLTVFTNSAKMTEIMSRITFGKPEIVLMGLPRNDILFNEIDGGDLLQIKMQLHLPLDKKIVLFAPTFRNDGMDVDGKNVERSGLQQLKMIDFKILFDTLFRKYKKDFVFVARFHYHVSSLVDWNKLNDEYPGRIINGNLLSDMSPYLKCADILITDASSCAFDYSSTKRPCLLFFPDYEHYKNAERGFYYNLEDLPFPLSITFDDLITTINTFNQKDYENSVDKMLQEYGFVDDGRSTERIVDYILSKK